MRQHDPDHFRVIGQVVTAQQQTATRLMKRTEESLWTILGHESLHIDLSQHAQIASDLIPARSLKRSDCHHTEQRGCRKDRATKTQLEHRSRAMLVSLVSQADGWLYKSLNFSRFQSKLFGSQQNRHLGRILPATTKVMAQVCIYEFVEHENEERNLNKVSL